jgi:hypothetical protein
VGVAAAGEGAGVSAAGVGAAQAGKRKEKRKRKERTKLALSTVEERKEGMGFIIFKLPCHGFHGFTLIHESFRGNS